VRQVRAVVCRVGGAVVGGAVVSMWGVCRGRAAGRPAGRAGLGANGGASRCTGGTGSGWLHAGAARAARVLCRARGTPARKTSAAAPGPAAGRMLMGRVGVVWVAAVWVAAGGAVVQRTVVVRRVQARGGEGRSAGRERGDGLLPHFALARCPAGGAALRGTVLVSWAVRAVSALRSAAGPRRGPCSTGPWRG
jgi:hypothetical protein